METSSKVAYSRERDINEGLLSTIVSVFQSNQSKTTQSKKGKRCSEGIAATRAERQHAGNSDGTLKKWQNHELYGKHIEYVGPSYIPVKTIFNKHINQADEEEANKRDKLARVAREKAEKNWKLEEKRKNSASKKGQKEERTKLARRNTQEEEREEFARENAERNKQEEYNFKLYVARNPDMFQKKADMFQKKAKLKQEEKKEEAKQKKSSQNNTYKKKFSFDNFPFSLLSSKSKKKK